MCHRKQYLSMGNVHLCTMIRCWCGCEDLVFSSSVCRDRIRLSVIRVDG